MMVGIAIRDDAGVTHWAPYSSKSERAICTGQNITRELRRTSKPKLSLACEGYNSPNTRVNQVRRVSTLVSSVTCMTCILRM